MGVELERRDGLQDRPGSHAARSIDPGRAGSDRDLQRSLQLKASPFQLPGRSFQVGDPVDEDRPVSLEMVGEQEVWRSPGQLEHGHPGTHPLDRENDRGAQHLGEMRRFGGHVPAGRIDEVELLEGHSAQE